MEPAWEKVTGAKFGCSEYTDSTGRKLPMYSLTKTECLYVATKFNDEARAKLVLRWEALENERLNHAHTTEQDNLILARGLEAAHRQISRLQENLRWSNERGHRLIQKLLEFRLKPQYSGEELTFELLMKGLSECADIMWDCVHTNQQLCARVAMLEKKLGMYKPLPENLIDMEGGSL